MINTLLLIVTILTIFSITAITEPQQTAYAGKDTQKELCEENGGKWEDGACLSKTDDEDKAETGISSI